MTLEMTFKRSICCGFLLINDNIISVCKHVMLCFVTTSRTEKGCGKWHFFGSAILPGFGEPGGSTPLPRIPFIPFMLFIPQNYNNSIYYNASAHPFFISFLKFIFLNLRKHNIATFFSRTPMKWNNNRHLIMGKKIVLTAGHTTKDLKGCPGLIWKTQLWEIHANGLLDVFFWYVRELWFIILHLSKGVRA